MKKELECEICGRRIKHLPGGNCRIHRHHIKPKLYGGDDSKENICILCSKCHSMAHKEYRNIAIKLALKINCDYFKSTFSSFKLINMVENYVECQIRQNN